MKKDLKQCCSVSLTSVQKETLKRLGGSAWLQKILDARSPTIEIEVDSGTLKAIEAILDAPMSENKALQELISSRSPWVLENPLRGWESPPLHSAWTERDPK